MNLRNNLYRRSGKQHHGNNLQGKTSAFITRAGIGKVQQIKTNENSILRLAFRTPVHAYEISFYEYALSLPVNPLTRQEKRRKRRRRRKKKKRRRRRRRRPPITFKCPCLQLLSRNTWFGR